MIHTRDAPPWNVAVPQLWRACESAVKTSRLLESRTCSRAFLTIDRRHTQPFHFPAPNPLVQLREPRTAVSTGTTKHHRHLDNTPRPSHGRATTNY